MVDRRYYEQSYDAMRVRKEELENRNLELSECERSWAKGDSLPATLSPRAIWPTGSSVRVIGGLLLALCLCSPARADIRECMEATCRIEVRQDDGRIGFGTGCIFATDDKFAYVLTNAHVAEREGTPLELVFIRSGFPQKVAGQTSMSVKRNLPGGDSYSPDCAVVAVPIEQFAGRCPKPIPINTSRRLKQGEEIISVGCPEGSNPTTMSGHVSSVNQWNVEFYPAPKGGRSGSPICDPEGTCIFGLVAWNGGGVGIAQQAHSVVAAFGDEYQVAVPVCGGSGGGAPVGRGPGSVPTQGGGCQNGSCGPSHGGMSGNVPTNRVPIDELGPVVPLTPVPTQPTQSTPPCPQIDENALVRRIELLIDAKIAALPKPAPGPSGPPGPAGPQGPAGPAGNDGSAGTAVEIDYDKLAEALARKNPSLTRDEVVAIVKEHCANKPDTDSTRPNPLPGYYEIRPKTKGAN